MTPPAPLFADLQEVSQGKPFPWCWLATCDEAQGARVRTVRLLSYNLRQLTFTFASHSGHSKHRQFSFDPRVQLCLLREQPILQVRLDGIAKTTRGSQHPLGERLWAKVYAEDRQSLFGADPDQLRPPENFVLVDLACSVAEVLRLQPGRRQRSLYRYTDSGWIQQELPL